MLYMQSNIKTIRFANMKSINICIREEIGINWRKFGWRKVEEWKYKAWESFLFHETGLRQDTEKGAGCSLALQKPKLEKMKHQG